MTTAAAANEAILAATPGPMSVRRVRFSYLVDLANAQSTAWLRSLLASHPGPRHSAASWRLTRAAVRHVLRLRGEAR